VPKSYKTHRSSRKNVRHFPPVLIRIAMCI